MSSRNKFLLSALTAVLKQATAMLSELQDSTPDSSHKARIRMMQETLTGMAREIER